MLREVTLDFKKTFRVWLLVLPCLFVCINMLVSEVCLQSGNLNKAGQIP